ncbi:hypothetical protein [Lentibacillus songyuanensis]|uniref:hypothetical protein n=1 Tax=Lentibacillus songyuanensis TaxID=3136161 RepID=UPI00386207B1
MLAGLFNFIFGCFIFLRIFSWPMSLLYIADAFGWVLDPTLEPGVEMLFIFLFLAIILCIIYFSTEWFAIIVAGVFLAAHFGLWFKSLNHTTVASSTLILALQSAIALIGGLIFFKKKNYPTKRLKLVFCDILRIYIKIMFIKYLTGVLYLGITER